MVTYIIIQLQLEEIWHNIHVFRNIFIKNTDLWPGQSRAKQLV